MLKTDNFKKPTIITKQILQVLLLHKSVSHKCIKRDYLLLYTCMSPIVSPYSPEIEFPRNALTRLEVVMGIQIVSVLAKLHSPLTSSSGVKLQQRVGYDGYKIALPDPDEEPAQYVVEVVLQWSARHSRRLPTWRQLLTVLQDIGLVPLSQQIEEFLKGK